LQYLKTRFKIRDDFDTFNKDGEIDQDVMAGYKRRIAERAGDDDLDDEVPVDNVVVGAEQPDSDDEPESDNEPVFDDERGES